VGPPLRGIGEGWRKLAHLATLLTIPFFRHLGPTPLLLLTALALAASWALGPILFHRLARAGEGWPRFSLAVAAFPLGSLLLLLAFPGRPEIPAGALAILAAGDAAAGAVGRRLRRPALPWNPAKSVAGSSAFVVAAFVAAGWAYRYVSGATILSSFALVLPAVLVAALVEGIPSRLGDNLSIVVSSGLLLGYAAKAGLLPWGETIARIPLALFAVGLLAFAALRAHAIDRAGAAAGSALGGLAFLFLGPRGFLPLALFVVLGSLASRLREGPRRPRSARHAAANLLVPAYLALLIWLGGGTALWAAYAGALAAALSDTLSGEIGMRFGGRPRLILGLRPVARGANGGMTAIGTAAGALGSLALPAAASAAGLLPGGLVLLVAASGLAGNLFDSLLGATLEEKGFLGNEEVNFLAALTGALLAALLAALR
jgi:uncharacterized protein (TIGR00297 family)